MEPETGGYFNGSMLFKASVLTFSFTAIYFYRTGTTVSLVQLPAVKKDNTAAIPAKKPAVKKKKKTIYLSFDDGPDKGSKNVMAIIKNEQVYATLFVVGRHVYDSREQASAYDSAGQCHFLEICNHSYTHAFENRYASFYSHPDSAMQDFKRCADSLRFTNNIVRTPGRNIWRTENISSTDIKASAPAGDSLQQAGYSAIGWDIEWHYNIEQRPVQTDSEMVQLVDSAFTYHLTKTAGHLVVLAHDRNFKKSDDSAKLHRFIVALKQKNEYDFEIMSKYPGLTKDSSAPK